MKGYGFITPDDGGAPVFVRRSEFVDYREHGIKVRDGELVSYDVVIGEGWDLERNEAVPEARNVHPLGGLKLRLRTENEPTFDVEAAGLRAEGADLLVAIEALARKLEHALPHATKVRRRSTRPFSKSSWPGGHPGRMKSGMLAVSLATAAVCLGACEPVQSLAWEPCPEPRPGACEPVLQIR